MKLLLNTCFSLFVFVLSAQDYNKWEKFDSPNGKIEFVLTTGEELLYSIKSDYQPVINEGKLGLEFENAGVLGRNMRFENIVQTSVDEQWEPVLHKNKVVTNKYNQVHFYLTETVYPGRKLQVIVRLFDNGVAFRYKIEGETFPNELILKEELTSFSFWMNSVCWAADFKSYTSQQESVYEKQSVVNISQDAFIGLPVLAKSGTKYVAITEADLNNWAGLYLKRSGAQTKDASLVAHLSKSKDKDANQSVGKISLPALSPWRVFLLGDNPGVLIESDIVQNLSEPSVIEDVSWIKPGLCAMQSWWSKGVEINTSTLKQHIDFAATNNFPYMLIDTEWYGEPAQRSSNALTADLGLDMPEVLRHAKASNVKLWLWVHQADLNKNMEKAFALYQSWGIAGVKIDKISNDEMGVVNWLQSTAALAAKYHLMISYGGAGKPTGLQRTYPNLMTTEAVLGNEHNKWSYRVTPEHNVTIPFTRMLAGPMDYAPGGFQNRGIGAFKPQTSTLVMGTRCHELAKFVVYESPLTFVCDHPSNYENQPGLDFLKRVPTVWDETKVLQGEVGEYIIIARRTGKQWFVAGMTNSSPREMTVDLSALASNATSISLWKDKTDGANTELIHRRESTDDDHTLLVSLAAGGGFVAILE